MRVYLDEASGAVLHPWLEMCAELLQIVSQKFIATLKTHFMNANALMAPTGAQGLAISVCLSFMVIVCQELSIFIF